jgi:hypothetical protein
MHHLVHQVCGVAGCTPKVPTRVLYPAVPTSHYLPTCPRMGAAAGYCPRRCSGAGQPFPAATRRPEIT